MFPFKILGINHIGIAAKDSEKTSHFFSLLGIPHLADELVKTQKTMTRMYASQKQPKHAFEPRLELLINEQGQEGPIGKFLEKKGGGIHHIALTVDHIENAIAALKSQGVRMIDESPRSGAHQTRIAFVHPEATGGILFELVQEATSVV